MANAAITRTVTIYPQVSGGSTLVEYRGSSYDVVALDIEASPATTRQLRDMKLAEIRGMSLVSLRDKPFTEAIPRFRLLPTLVRFANVNGIAHVIAPTQGLSAGSTVYVSAMLVG